MAKTPVRKFGEPGLRVDIGAVHRACENPSTSAEVLRDLADAHWNVSGVLPLIASHPNCSAKLFGRLCTRELPVRVALAGNPAVPSKLLAKLARDPGEGVATAVASNPALAVDAQRCVAEHANAAGCEALAGRADLTSEAAWVVFERFASVRSVLSALAKNPASPPAVLAALAARRPGVELPMVVRSQLLANPALGSDGLAHIWANRSSVDVADSSLAAQVAVHRSVDDMLLGELPARVVWERCPTAVSFCGGDAAEISSVLASDFDGSLNELRELAAAVLTHAA